MSAQNKKSMFEIHAMVERVLWDMAVEGQAELAWGRCLPPPEWMKDADIAATVQLDGVVYVVDFDEANLRVVEALHEHLGQSGYDAHSHEIGHCLARLTHDEHLAYDSYALGHYDDVVPGDEWKGAE